MPGFLRLSYWFNLQPFPFLPTVDKGILVFFGVLLVLAIGLWIYAMRSVMPKLVKKTIRRIAEASFWLGLFGMLLYWFTDQRIYVLGARFMYLIWVALLAGYVWSIGRYILVEIPEQKKKQEEREALEKWMPKKGK